LSALGERDRWPTDVETLGHNFDAASLLDDFDM